MTRRFAAIILTLIVTLSPVASAETLPADTTVDIEQAEKLRGTNEAAQEVADDSLSDGYTRDALNQYKELSSRIQSELSILHQMRFAATSHMGKSQGVLREMLSDIVETIDEQLAVAHTQLVEVQQTAQLIRVTARVRR